MAATIVIATPRVGIPVERASSIAPPELALGHGGANNGQGDDHDDEKYAQTAEHFCDCGFRTADSA